MKRSGQKVPMGFGERIAAGGMVLTLALGASGCRGPAAGRGAPPEAGGEAAAPASGPLAPSPLPEAPVPAPPAADAVPVGSVEPGAYADDERFLVVAATWDARLLAAADRLELATGLSFRARAAPRVVWGPLGDERVLRRLESEIADGRRRAVVRVNAEPVLGGTADVDRVVAHGLAEAALASRPSGPPPAWFVAWAGMLAAGDAADTLDRLVRAAAAGGAPVAADPDAPQAAESTAVAVALLLGERSTPLDVRRLLALVAEGEEPGPLVARWIGDPSGFWVGAAREILEDAASGVDASGDRLAAELAASLDELGPEGLEQAVRDAQADGRLGASVGLQVEALRLEAAVRAGDESAARAALERAPPEPHVLARLADPGSHLLAAARAESMPHGSPIRASTLLLRFDADYPSHRRRAEAWEAMAGLFGLVPEGIEERLVRRVLETRGPAGLDSAAVARRVRVMLDDARPGAARRFLASLGARTDDGDLAGLVGEVHLAEAEPSAEARAANAARAEAWLGSPSPATRGDLADGGAVGAAALAARLPGLAADRRAAAVRLLAEAAGVAQAVALLAPAWRASPERLGGDLEALTTTAGWADLRRAVAAFHPEVETDARAAAEWERVALGLGPEILAAEDDLLSRLHSPEFSVRKAAFDAVVARGPAAVAPAFLVHFSRDPSILLRRLAVREAGRAGVVPVVRSGLADPAWAVRQVACAAALDADPEGLAGDLAALLRAPDPDERVRASAASALVVVARRDPGWVRPLASVVRLGEPALAEGVAAALSDLPRDAVARAAAAELWAEAVAAPARADRTVLFRLFVVYRRASGTDPRYDPSLGPEEVRAIVASLPENQRRDAGRP